MRQYAKPKPGDKFGRLTLIERIPSPNPKYARWLCKCECGNDHHAYQHALISEKSPTRSCGCLLVERRRFGNFKHGGYQLPEYTVWEAMRSRCYNQNAPKFYNHGGRGIKVCDRWNDFAAFYEDMGNRPEGRYTLERRDNDGNYSPENCYWATYSEQQRNRRNTVFLEHAGMKLTYDEWAERIGIRANTIRCRIRLGWSASDALQPHIFNRHRQIKEKNK